MAATFKVYGSEDPDVGLLLTLKMISHLPFQAEAGALNNANQVFDPADALHEYYGNSPSACSVLVDDAFSSKLLYNYCPIYCP